MSEQKKHEVHIHKGKDALAEGGENGKGANHHDADAARKDHAADSGNEVETLKKEIDAKDRAIADYLNQMKRTQADFENYRKRVDKEREGAAVEGVSKLLCEILSVADDLDRSVSASRKNHDAASLSKGVEMVHKKLLNVLGKQGLLKIECTGRQFDPRLHEAVMAIESKELKDNAVAEELECGYIFKNKVLRPAKVKVVRNE